MLSENVPITAVSKILGHANPAITMGIYAHELKEDFARFESASRFCTAFDELRNYLRIRSTGGEHVPADIRRENFTNKWSTLMTELLA
jgi:hypothetical protein